MCPFLLTTLLSFVQSLGLWTCSGPSTSATTTSTWSGSHQKKTEATSLVTTLVTRVVRFCCCCCGGGGGYCCSSFFMLLIISSFSSSYPPPSGPDITIMVAWPTLQKCRRRARLEMFCKFHYGLVSINSSYLPKPPGSRLS